MSQTSGKLLKLIILYILLPFAIVKVVYSVFSYLYLAKDDIIVSKSQKLSYHYTLDLANKMFPTKTNAAPVIQIEATDRIRDIKLKGTYLEDVNSFIVVEDHLGTTFLYKGDRYMGYVLQKIYENRAVFEKNGKHYDIVIDEGGAKEVSSMTQTDQEIPGGPPEPSLSNGFGPVSVTRDTIQSYIKNPNKIWRNIRIQEVRRNGQIDGFRINYVKRGSFFDRAGLKSGDIIKAIDGSEIRTLSDVMRYYNNINNLDGLSLTVLRADQEVELEFNIN